MTLQPDPKGAHRRHDDAVYPSVGLWSAYEAVFPSICMPVPTMQRHRCVIPGDTPRSLFQLPIRRFRLTLCLWLWVDVRHLARSPPLPKGMWGGTHAWRHAEAPMGSRVSARVARVGYMTACAVAEAEERAGARVDPAAGGASVALRTRVPWARRPTRVTFPGRTALSF
jgi:hypothetical protein